MQLYPPPLPSCRRRRRYCREMELLHATFIKARKTLSDRAPAEQQQPIMYPKAGMAAQDAVCAFPKDASGNTLPFPPLRCARFSSRSRFLLYVPRNIFLPSTFQIPKT